MKVIHRYNSDERQHFLLKQHYIFKLKPRLLYVGFLEKHGGWCEEAHSHDFLEIIFVTDGKGTIAIEDKFYDVRKGDLIVYNADKIHFEKSSVEDPMSVLFLPTGLFPQNTKAFTQAAICTAFFINTSTCL